MKLESMRASKMMGTRRKSSKLIVKGFLPKGDSFWCLELK